MYVPTPYQETRSDILIAAIQQASFGTLITHDGEDIRISHVPFAVVDTDPLQLVTHLARLNPQAQADPARGVASFVLDQAYIHPGWYPSKAEHGRVVPTWNYVAVEARGPLQKIEEGEELRAILNAVTVRHEADRAAPWSLADAPPDYGRRLMRGIVGLTMTVTTLTGAWKLNQTKSASDHRGVVEGLRTEGKAGIAALMEQARAEGRDV